MIEVEQTRFGGPDKPPEERGNCFAACLASILEVGLEEIPRSPADESGWDQILTWLKGRGWWIAWVSRDPEGYWPGYTIGGVASMNPAIREATDGGGHVVVCHNNRPVWNPNPRDSRPLEELWPTEFYLLYPLSAGEWIRSEASA